MGSICWIDTNPEKWKVYGTDKKLKDEYGGEYLLKVCFGTFDDEGIWDMETYMRPSVYHRIKRGEYRVSPDSKWKHKLILVDKAGDEVAPFNEFCY